MLEKRICFRNIFFTLLILLLFFYSCRDKVPYKNSINGIWQSIGSGWILHIKDSTYYNFYDITSISCLPSRKGKLEELKKFLKLKNDTLSLLKGVITYKFIRLQKLPKLCNTILDEMKAEDPLYNFEVFAETVKEHYAFMKLNNINWNNLYKKQKSKLNKQSSNIELYLVIDETLKKINDNHAFLEATETVNITLDTIHKTAQNVTDNKLVEYGDFQVAQIVAEHHLQEEMTKNSWLMQWGKLNDDIGYILIKAMWLYADLKIPKLLIKKRGYVDAYVETFHNMYEGDYIEKEVMGVQRIMDKVMKDLSKMKSIVIDIRFNGGGQDAVSFAILRRFISQKLQVATQKLKYGNGYTPILPLLIKGTKNAYTKPIYVLTSQQTGSAAEAFVIATMSMKNVKRIGSSTSGAMSTALEKILPNGWIFSISNEVYMDNSGKNYENIGLPVDYDLKYPKDRQTFFRSVVDNLEADKKDILMAIQKLKK